MAAGALELQAGECLVLVNASADLFALTTSSEDGARAGRRIHLARLGSGLIFNPLAALDDAPCRCIVVIQAGAHAVRARLSELQAFPDAETWTGLIDAWLHDVSSLIEGTRPLTELRYIDGETSLEVVAEESLGSRSLRWLRVDDVSMIQPQPVGGRALRLGSAWPLTSGLWVECRQPGTLHACDTADVYRSQELLQSLAQYHQYVAARVFAQIAARDEISAERGRKSRFLEEVALVEVNAGLERLISRSGEKVSSPSPTSEGEAAFNVCATALKALDVRFSYQIVLDREVSSRARTRRMLGDAGVRVRDVLLEQGWWRHDGGVLIGFLEAGAAPVALLPDSNARYRMVDGEGREVAVTRAVAGTLSPNAFSVIRPLPVKPLDRIGLLRFALRAQGGSALLAIGTSFVAALIALIVPSVTGRIVDLVIPGGRFAELYQFTALLLSAALVSGIFAVSQGVCLQRIRGHSNAVLQTGIWDRILRLPVEFFRGFTVGDLSSRALGINAISSTFTGLTLPVLFGGVFSLFSVGQMLWHDWQLTLYAVAATVLAVLILCAPLPRQLRLGRTVAESQGMLDGRVLQFVSSITKLRVAGAERRAYAQWAGGFVEQTERYASMKAWIYFGDVFRTGYTSVATLLLFAIMSWLDRPLSTGQFIAFSIAFQQFMTGILGLTGALTPLLTTLPIYERARPILEATPENHAFKIPPGSLMGRIKVQNVSYRQQKSGPLTLDGVSFDAKPGDFIAICGASGSGKSTLLRLLLGFAQPQSGEIAYDEQCLANLDVVAVRRQVGVVLQHSRLMFGTILQNIVMNDDFPISDVWEVARKVGIADDIAQLPMRLQTVISAGETSLSAGQQQKLLLARALIRKPRLLILDEATSALDNSAQAQITRTLQSIRSTRIVVAHRLSTIVDADTILVLERGRIVQRGTFSELIAEPRGVFASLAQRQLL